MTTFNKVLLPSVLAATLGLGMLAARPAQAQDYHRYTRTETVTTRYIHAGPLTPGQRKAQRLHRQAVQFDHQATYEDQHGHPKVGARLARQASQLNALAYQAAHR
jgi:hypothetical protein